MHVRPSARCFLWPLRQFIQDSAITTDTVSHWTVHLAMLLSITPHCHSLDDNLPLVMCYALLDMCVCVYYQMSVYTNQAEHSVRFLKTHYYCDLVCVYVSAEYSGPKLWWIHSGCVLLKDLVCSAFYQLSIAIGHPLSYLSLIPHQRLSPIVGWRFHFLIRAMDFYHLEVN